MSNVNHKFIITLTGPSGSGKSTLEKHLVDNKIAVRLMGYTTREPRDGEIDGVDVNFVDFETGKKNFENPSSPQKVFYKGNYYGKTLSEVEENFKTHNVQVCVVTPDGIDELRRFANTQENLTIVPYYVTASTVELITRMLNRVRSQSSPNLAYYADRIKTMIEREIAWGDSNVGYKEIFINEEKEDLIENTQAIMDHLRTLRCAYL